MMRPRTMSPTEGSAAAGVDEVCVVAATATVGMAFLLAALEVTGPAKLAWMLDEKMCAPEPGWCEEDDASVSPGRAKPGIGILSLLYTGCREEVPYVCYRVLGDRF